MKTREIQRHEKIVSHTALIFVLTFFFCGCANQKMEEKQTRIQQMSDRELTDRYHEVAERLDELDRDAETEKTREKEMQSPDGTNQKTYPEDQLHHMHIGDTWNLLRQEKKMLLRELGARGINPDVSAH